MHIHLLIIMHPLFLRPYSYFSRARDCYAWHFHALLSVHSYVAVPRVVDYMTEGKGGYLHNLVSTERMY